MAIRRFLILGIISLSALQAVEKNHALFLLKSQEIDKAFDTYREVAQNGHDYELLEQMATILLQQGISHTDPAIQLLTMYGLSISHFQCPLFILEEGLHSSNPYVQASAIQTLAQMSEDGCDELLIKAMQSPFLMIRIQAAYALSQRSYKKAVGPIESLMHKLPGQAWIFFPELYALLGDKQAISILKGLTHHPEMAVRLSAIFNAAKYRRDDLLPAIRSMATHVDFAEQEMAAFALGTFHDLASKEILLKLKESKEPSVSLSAAHALRDLGDEKALETILHYAKERNPFAISLLGRYEEGKELLRSLTRDKDPNVRLQTTLSLLKQRDSWALLSLGEFLLRDQRDLGFTPIFTQGHSLRSWRIVPLAQAKTKNDEGGLQAISLSLREEMLTDALELDESLFLMIARKLFDFQQLELIPLLVQLLQNLDSPSARKLLHEVAETSPMLSIRTFCNLALYRLKDPNFDEKKLLNWIHKEMDHHIIEFSEKKNSKQENPQLAYQLTPQETSRLLIESYQALAERRDPQAIDTLVIALAKGNSKNRYALAGLLLYAIQ